MTEPAVVIDISTSAGRVRTKLAHYPGTTWCVIRDPGGPALRWHVLAAETLLLEIAAAPPDSPLGHLLDPERHRAASRKAGSRNSARSHSRPRVILDGTDVVGVLPGDPEGLIPGLYENWMPALGTSALDSERRARFLAWPLITAPSAAGQGEEITITITLSRDRHVSRPPIRLELSDGKTEFDLDVDLAAVGFDAPGGWRHKLHIEVGGELPAISIPLSVRSDAPSALALIHVAFLKDGVVCGSATCAISIGLGDPLLVASESSPCIMPGTDEEPADLLVMIRKADGNSATGRYLWSMSSMRAEVDPNPVPIDLGDDARTFIRTVMHDVIANDNTVLLELVLRSIGKDIAAHVPPSFWRALHAVAKTLDGRPPSVLIYSAEEFVPWELALMEQPLDDGPPFLAAQATVGRWLYSESGMIPASPPASIPVRDVAVLASEYDESTYLTSLTAALAEAKYMVDAYGAITVEATEDAVRLLLDAKMTRNDGSPAEINIVHLACHADSDPTRPGDAGFYLASGRRITPRVFGASRLGSRFGPLLFINACEAGVAQRLLAQTAGFAGVSLRGGFRGFIAPLWSVGDEAASQVAHQFYAAVFGGEIPSVGSVLRDIRRSAMPIRQATPFSYIYYGHPHLRLGAKDDRRIAVQDDA